MQNKSCSEIKQEFALLGEISFFLRVEAFFKGFCHIGKQIKVTKAVFFFENKARKLGLRCLVEGAPVLC